MPAAEVEITTALVAGLLAEQRPDLVGRNLSVLGNGWDNVSVRIGEDLVGRFPRRSVSVGLIHNEASCLPLIASALPLPIPVPEFVGSPGAGYPWPWSISRLLPGVAANTVASLDEAACATSVGEFLAALHRPAPAIAPENPFRGVPLVDRDRVVRDRLSVLASAIDVGRAVAVWEDGLYSDPYDGPPVWLHGDFQPHNLLASDGRIVAVADWGDITSGDPATDLSIAWSLLEAEFRTILWEAYGRNDDSLVVRSKAWALNLGTAILANSADNPVLEAVARRTLAAVLADD